MPKRMRIPNCHPDRRHRGHGLCQSCYDAARSARRYASAPPAICHPERKAIHGGLCAGCYSRSRGYVRPKRPHKPRPYDPVRGRRQHLAQYGLTPEAYDALVAEQGGRCYLCGREESPLHVDHDHETGLRRRLLCNMCNRGLGFLGDDPDLLAAAADYVRQYRRRSRSA